MVGTPLRWDDYATAWARLHGGFDPRAAAPVVRGWLRFAYHVGYLLGRLRVTPTAVTAAGVLLCFCVPLFAVRPSDGPFLAALFVLLAAVADSVDGAVAVVTGRSTRLGYVYDSLADRLGEIAWLLAFWLVGAPGALVVAGGALSWLHEYVRARAVAAGMREIGAVTVGERPTRVSVALVGLLVAGLAGLVRPELAAGTITLATAVWVLLAGFGLGQLLSAVRRALLAADAPTPARTR
ncbi:CDP-alcohol phosphatidyltransferase family protein [Micromonospora echinospora]|uniref:CDP-alcohol phosphatidyltransferase family protein n=1 Tax=Micromonospora echinospora TaxID=1877 RepID=UPI0037AB4BD7